MAVVEAGEGTSPSETAFTFFFTFGLSFGVSLIVLGLTSTQTFLTRLQKEVRISPRAMGIIIGVSVVVGQGIARSDGSWLSPELLGGIFGFLSPPVYWSIRNQ